MNIFVLEGIQSNISPSGMRHLTSPIALHLLGRSLFKSLNDSVVSGQLSCRGNRRDLSCVVPSVEDGCESWLRLPRQLST